MSLKKLFVEFVGTFLFLLIITMSVRLAPTGFAPIPIAVMLTAMIYAGGHFSGGHFNPAVTLGAVLRGATSSADLPGYWVAQLLGAVLGSVLGNYLVGSVNPELITAPSGSMMPVLPGLLAEFLGTFALVYVVLNVATAKATQGNSFYGLAIGFTVLACAFTLGAVSGGAFNPAVATGVSVAGMTSWANIWIFWVAELLAGAAAALVFNYLQSDVEVVSSRRK